MKSADKKIILSTIADFFTGMSTAWAFVVWVALNNVPYSFSLQDLIISSLLAILSLGVAIGIKLNI